ncbi:hypothetical protein D3C78_1159310 [compost metagenome]
MLFAYFTYPVLHIVLHRAFCLLHFAVNPGTDKLFRQQVFFTEGKQRTLPFIQPLGQHFAIVIGRTSGAVFLQRRHQLQHIRRIILVNAATALPDQHHLLPMREEPDRGGTQPNLFKQRFIPTLTIDKTARPPWRQFARL